MTTDHTFLAHNRSADDDAAVRDIVARVSEAQNDPETFLDLHTPDTVIVNIAGRRVLGRDAMAQAMAAALASPLGSVRTSVDIMDVRFPAVDLAVVSCVKTVHDERAEADRGDLPAAGALSYTLARTLAGWRIVLAQTTPILG